MALKYFFIVQLASTNSRAVCLKTACLNLEETRIVNNAKNSEIGSRSKNNTVQKLITLNLCLTLLFCRRHHCFHIFKLSSITKCRQTELPDVHEIPRSFAFFRFSDGNDRKVTNCGVKSFEFAWQPSMHAQAYMSLSS